MTRIESPLTTGNRPSKPIESPSPTADNLPNNRLNQTDVTGQLSPAHYDVFVQFLEVMQPPNESPKTAPRIWTPLTEPSPAIPSRLAASAILCSTIAAALFFLM